MGNCLVTKLKGTVDNDDLSTLGHLVFEVAHDPNAGNYVWLNHGNFAANGSIHIVTGGTVSLKDTATGSDRSGDFSHTSPFDFYFNGYGKLELGQYYDFTAISLTQDIYPKCNLFEKSVYMNSLTSIDVTYNNNRQYEKQDLTVVKGSCPSLTSFRIGFVTNGDGTFGDIARVYPNLTSIDIMYNPWGLSDAENIGKLTNLSSLRIQSGNVSTDNFIIKLVQGFRGNVNRQTNSLTLVTSDFPITFDGNPVANDSHSLSWTADTITLDGTTIDA